MLGLTWLHTTLHDHYYYLMAGPCPRRYAYEQHEPWSVESTVDLCLTWHGRIVRGNLTRAVRPGFGFLYLRSAFISSCLWMKKWTRSRTWSSTVRPVTCGGAGCENMCG